jgi:hypothetical protein
MSAGIAARADVPPDAEEVPSNKYQVPRKCGEAADSLLVLVPCYLSLRPAGRNTTLTLHFAMKISRTPRAKNSAAERVSLSEPDIRTPHSARRRRAEVTSIRYQVSKKVRQSRGLNLGTWHLLLVTWRASAAHLTPDLHRRSRADWLCPRGLSARWEFVMRNRSATVAGFHGLPWFPKVSKERQKLFQS